MTNDHTCTEHCIERCTEHCVDGEHHEVIGYLRGTTDDRNDVYDHLSAIGREAGTRFAEEMGAAIAARTGTDLKRLNAEQFDVILELRDEIHDLRQFITGIQSRWNTEALAEVTRCGGHLRAAPELPPRRRHPDTDRDGITSTGGTQ